MKKSYPISLFMSLFMALLLISCGEKKKNAEEAINNTPAELETTLEAKNWAEKLGWPAGKKVIMLHADDIGMCPEANIAAKEQLTKGEIQSAAVMIPCPNAEEFINWAKENPAMDASAEEVEKEIRAQIEQSIAWGYRPDHIDTHMGTLFGDPSYVKAYMKVAQEYGIPANIIDISVPSVLAEFRAKGYPMDDSVVKMTEEYTLPKLDFFSSAPKADSYEEKVEAFKTLIKSLPPGLTEIIFHPSVETDNLRGITGSWQQRVWESQIFGDPDLINFFKEEGIIFTNWKEIMTRFNSMK